MLKFLLPGSAKTFKFGHEFALHLLSNACIVDVLEEGERLFFGFVYIFRKNGELIALFFDAELSAFTV